MDNSEYWVFEAIDPIIFSIGPLAVRWYGLMYLLGFLAAYFIAKARLKRVGWSGDELSDLLFYSFIGVVVGGRMGYVFFYQFSTFLADPLYLFKIWTGGMAFHGGLLGVLVAIWFFARQKKTTFLLVGDFVAPLVPLGLAAGRLGNFINGELWGRTTDVPWAIIFPAAGNIPRHPSQLYQFALEGMALFFIIWLYSQKPRPTGAVGGLFLAGYGVFRFFVEFFREPDAHIGLYPLGLSQGQLLSLPMIIGGVALIIYAYKRREVSL